MHAGDGLASGDPADQWVRDPVTGEYRLRLPGEPLPEPRPARIPPGPEPGPRAAAPATGPAERPAAGGRRRVTATDPPGGRAARRRSGSRRPRTGLWLAGAVGFLLMVAGGGAYALLRPSGATARPAASGSPSPCHRTPVSAATAAARPSPDPTGLAALPRGPKAAPINVRVTVYNGSGTFGQAEKVLDWMQNTEGFLRTSNGGPANDAARTTLVYAPDHVDQARTLAAAMGLPASALKGTGKGTGLRDPMVLTLGHDFRGIGKPFAEPSPTPSAAATPSCASG